MARFVYRLQKVYDLRERKKKEQEERVQKAQDYVREVENSIEAKKNEIRETRQNMMTASHMLLGTYDNFLHLLGEQLEELYEELKRAHMLLEIEKQKLIKAQSDFEAMVKHKDNAREAWKEEEKKLEMKQLDEVAGQRFFRSKAAELEEAEEEARAKGLDWDPNDYD